MTTTIDLSGVPPALRAIEPVFGAGVLGMERMIELGAAMVGPMVAAGLMLPSR